MRQEFPPAWLSERGTVFWQRTTATAQRVYRAAVPVSRRGLQVVKETGKTTVARLRTIPWQLLAYRHWKVLLGIVAVILLVLVIKVPQWQAASWQGQPGMEPKDLAKLQNDARTTLVQALGGAVLLIGLYFTLKNLQLTQDRQITEHYTRAVEQLGSDKLELRLGAIYALERISRDSDRDHWPIMEILTAYVREHAPWEAEEEDHSQKERYPKERHPSERPLRWTSIPMPDGMFLGRDDEPRPALAVDIQAILTVLGRRTRTYEKKGVERLNLQYTTLRGAIIKGAQLQGAWLSHTQLQRADLQGAQLQGAHLDGAQLQRAHLDEAELQGAWLWDAVLEGATLVVAQLQKAFLIGTRLQRADLRCAQLQEAVLAKAQLQRADLRGAQLQGAMLHDAELQGALLLDTQLEGADLLGANLTEAIGLTIEQLSTVETLYEAVLDASLREQIEQRYPHLLEEPQD